eukprot:2937404-Lingulodinium_polyedra.AAC.2
MASSFFKDVLFSPAVKMCPRPRNSRKLCHLGNLAQSQADGWPLWEPSFRTLYMQGRETKIL